MKKKIIIVIALMVAGSVNVSAQLTCGTPAITNIENVKKLSSPQKRTANLSYILTVYFHVIRSSSGTGGVSTSNVASAYSRLNSDFNSHGIYFHWDGNVDYIDDNTYYYYVPNTNIFYENNHIDGIDIYLYPTNPNYYYPYSGLGNGVGMSSEYYVVGNDNGTPACMTSTISHEMGHVLNLWHTHHGTFPEGNSTDPDYDANQCKELVNGSNSSTCGDYVEDTPADPNLNGKVNSNCVYTGTGTDANNQAYSPDVTLIMSYAPKSCRTRFSTMQGVRMRESIENLPYLMHTRWYTISGPDHIIQSTQSGIYSIDNLPSAYTVEWSLSDSYYNQNCLQQNYPAQNQCTITRSSNYDMTNGTLTAVIKYNGVAIKTLTKTGLWVYSGFKGTYVSSLGPGTYSAPNAIMTAANTGVHVWSPSLIGATFSYSGDVTSPYVLHGNDYMEVNMPSSGSVIVVQVHCTNGENYNVPIVKAYVPHFSVAFSGNVLNITQAESVAENKAWTLEIVNAATGNKVFSKSVNGTAYTINAAKWQSGLYLVKATIGEQVLSEKVVLK